MTKTIKGVYTFIDGDKYRRAFISCSIECEIVVEKEKPESFILKPGSYFECGAAVSKTFKIIPTGKVIENKTVEEIRAIEYTLTIKDK